jgi:hypothetical protein
MGGFNTFLDHITGASDRRRARSETQKGIDDISGVALPSLQKLIAARDYRPELEKQSGISGYQDDPQTRAAQLQALQSLQQTADAGGLDAQTRADLSREQEQVNAQERGNREAILANQRARGLGGSGVELAAQLANQQGSAQRLNQQGLDTASLGEQRKSQALRDLASIGGNVRGQDFNQASSIAQANDRINQFNTQNKNAAQQANLANAQRISDYNRTALPQQIYQNAMGKAGSLASARNQQAANYNAQGQATAGITGGIIQGGITAAAAAMGGPAAGAAASNISKSYTPSANQQSVNNLVNQDSLGVNNYKSTNPGTNIMADNNDQYYSDARVKKDVEPFDSNEFLDELTGVKFRYTQPEKYGHGEKSGVMAQALQKNSPHAVSEDGEGVKRIDYSKITPEILASMADMNKRLNEIEEKHGKI